jgi:hypothetical protein
MKITQSLGIKDIAALRHTNRTFRNFLTWDFFQQLLQRPWLAPEVVRRDDAFFLARLIDYGLDVNLVYPWGQSILDHAIVAGSAEIVSVLVSRGASLSPPVGIPPLHLAAKKRFVAEKIVRALLEGGAEVNAICTQSIDELPGGSTALRWALCTTYRPKIISVFFEYGADLNVGTPGCPVFYRGKWRPVIYQVVKWLEESPDYKTSSLHNPTTARSETPSHMLGKLVEILLRNGANPNDVVEDEEELELLGDVGKRVCLLLRTYREIWAKGSARPATFSHETY